MTKESRTHIEHPQVIFRENFNDEQSVRANGASTIDTVTFSDGVASFDGAASNLIYSNEIRNTLGSVVIDFTTSADVTTTQILIDTRGSAGGEGYIRN